MSCSALYASSWRSAKFAQQPDERFGELNPFVLIEADLANFKTEVFVVVSTPQGLKMDWDAMVGYNDPTISEFIAAGENLRQAVLRVRVERAEHFSDAFSSDQFICVKLSHPDELATLFAYTPATGGVAIELDELLDGNPQPLTVEIASRPQVPDKTAVELRTIKCRGWVWQEQIPPEE